MVIFAMNGQLDTGPLSELGDGETPLPDESEVVIGSDDPNEREMVLKPLRAYRSLTKDTSACLPATSLGVHHHIDTGDASPIMLKRRRQAQTDEGIVDSNVETMLMAGVIEEGNGGWGFPVILVRKKAGALNKITKKDVYPLPRIDETLEALGGALLFTTLDLRAGYWQLLVAPEDRDKTAYTTKKGFYRFNAIRVNERPVDILETQEWSAERLNMVYLLSLSRRYSGVHTSRD
ncbi:LOW QUALITY PROTEIN: Retroelement [Phytophthora megakarya]|uniref:Retroelement n=1 Tax=Phytophthora megakarya TaxID=4795 RepID=A0A225VXR5_9STRA|nr:LOW QUALITY PROTEIN: Retroelement [Phytophthora megakarya]